MIERFFIYGIIGWCIEIVWTAVCGGFFGDRELKGTTSIWMFPIYGSVVVLEPFFVLLSGAPIVLRGVVYMAFVFGAEFVSGLMLKRAGVCPWDYSDAKFNVAGVIRLDYAPCWFAVGLFYEWVFHFLIFAI